MQPNKKPLPEQQPIYSCAPSASIFAIAYALVAVFAFASGVFVGWIIWGKIS